MSGMVDSLPKPQFQQDLVTSFKTTSHGTYNELLNFRNWDQEVALIGLAMSVRDYTCCGNNFTVGSSAFAKLSVAPHRHCRFGQGILLYCAKCDMLLKRMSLENIVSI